MPMFPSGWTNEGTFELYNYRYAHDYGQYYAITDEWQNINGRQPNHLYMWTDGGWTTQKWTEWYNQNSNTFAFQSQYAGNISTGAIGYGCINIPGGSTGGEQLLDYSCNGVPVNEQFQWAYPGTPAANAYIGYSSYSSLDIAIGNNFPGNGAWVIAYKYGNSFGWKEQWIAALVLS
jgi:hypothetical protein